MSEIFVEGHRGYCARFPENTLISYEAAIDVGADGFEFDIWLSKDKIPVLMHDGNCKRTCGVDRHLRDMTLDEIKQLDAGYSAKFGDKFMGRGVEVPTLRELCELVRARRPDMALGVEIKEYTEETVDISVAILKEYGLFDRACFYAFDAQTIKWLKTKYNARVMGYPDFQMRRWNAEDGFKYYDDLGLSMAIVKSEIFDIYPKKQLPMHLYCADTPEDVALCLSKPGCYAITANELEPLMTALGRPMGRMKEI